MKTILRTIERHAMVCSGERVLVGLSGGPDSVALLDALVELRSALAIELVAAHLDHGLRAEAGEDETFCRELASQRGIPFVSERVDIAAGAAHAKRSIEDEARRVRYRFLIHHARRHGCRKVAVGHTMDDQAETLLMRLARGSGSRGLSSIYPVVNKGDIDIIRPLIDVRRGDLLARLDERGLAFRDDATNHDRRFTRSRLRHDILPFMADQLNRNLVETLARSAEILRDDESFIDGVARRTFIEAATVESGVVRFAIDALGAAHPAIRRRLTRLAIEHVRGDTANVTASHVSDVLALMEPGKSGREIHLPGAIAERSFDWLELRSRPSSTPPEPSVNGYNGFDYRLTIPAELPIKECRGVLTARLAESVRVGDEPGAAAGSAVVVGVEDGISELRVRSPRPSDRFRPLGGPGSKPLSRYLMERKVAKKDRRHVALVVGGKEERILWVAGHGISETARLGAGRRRLHLEWMSL